MSLRLVSLLGKRHIQKPLFAALVTGSKGAKFQKLPIINKKTSIEERGRLTNFGCAFTSSGIAAIASVVIGGQNCDVLGS